MIDVEAGEEFLKVTLTRPNEEDINLFGDIAQSMNRAMMAAIHTVQKELNVSAACAIDVWYLRTRRRHTPELEARLIELHKAGFAPLNMMEWPGRSN